MKKFLTSLMVAAAAFSTVSAAESVPYIHSFEGSNCLDGYTCTRFPSESPSYFRYSAQGQGTPYAYRDCVYLRSSYTVCDAMLISPEIALEAGVTYSVTYTCAESNSNRELVGMFAGQSTDPDVLKSAANSILVQGPNDFNNGGLVTHYVWGKGFTSADQAQTVEGEFTPATSGNYNFALWVCSDKDDGLYFGVYELAVKSKASGSVPADVTNITATANPLGYLKATVKCTTPDKNLDGTPLTITKLEFLRDGEVINTVSNPANNREYSFEDTGMTNGYHTYGAVCYNASGAGNPVNTARIYVGTYLPNPVTDLEAHEMGNGNVRLNWVAPTTTITGGIQMNLPADQLTYKVFAYDLEDNVTEEFGPFSTTQATITLKNIPQGEQQFLSFGVAAITSAGQGEITRTNPVVVGTPDVAPYFESFRGGNAQHTGMNESVKYNANWFIRDFTQDNDGGALRFEANGTYAEANYYTGLITLPAEAMYLNFYYSGYSNNPRVGLNVKISVDGGEFRTLEELEPSTADWKRATISLADYAGKTIQVCFNGISYGGSYMMIDNISISKGAAKDLTISDFVFPTTLERCQATEVSFTVLNLGEAAADNYSVSLFCNGEIIRTVESTEPLAAGAKAEVKFIVNTERTSPEQLTYQATVNYADDEVTDNNSSARIVVRVVTPELVTPSMLRGSVEGQTVTLTWQAPEGADFEADSPFHKLLGYTIYRDDKMVNWAPMKETQFVDKEVPYGVHTYYVVAVYDWATSGKSNTEEVDVQEPDSIDSIVAEGTATPVYTITGVMINRAATADDLRRLPTGIYVIGNRKVAVK